MRIRGYTRRVAAAAVLTAAVGVSSQAQKSRPQRTLDDVSALPLHVIEPRAASPNAVAIVLSGDGGWADIDERVGQGLAKQGKP